MLSKNLKKWVLSQMKLEDFPFLKMLRFDSSVYFGGLGLSGSLES